MIAEAAAGNMGAVPPIDGFNAFLRDTAHGAGAVLILDEVMTGFRVSRSGWYGIDGVAADRVVCDHERDGAMLGRRFEGGDCRRILLLDTPAAASLATGEPAEPVAPTIGIGL